MRILLVSPFDFQARGGVNQHILYLDNQFQRMGHETRILGAATLDYGEMDDGHIRTVGTALPIPSNGSQARITLSPLVINKVRNFLDEEPFDVIHAHEPLAPLLPLATWLYSKSLNVGTFHAARDSNIWYLYTKAVLDMFVDRLDVRIAVSEAAREFADNHFPGEYDIIPNGIDLEQYHPDVRPIPELADGHKNILFVGRYSESRKGFIHLLRAFPLVRSQFPEARLIVVGAGNRVRFERMLADEGIDNVVFVGAVDDRLKMRYYASCDVFCAPSTGRESFGIILLEALAIGKPVVASNITGYAGVIEHGVTGMLTKPKDSNDLALALVRMLADTELRQQVVENGLRHVQQFSWENVARQVIDSYKHGLALGPRERRPTGRLTEVLVGADG